MKCRIWIALALISVSSLGCATNASNCAGWSAINPSRKDVLTEGTVKQMLAHNEFGVKQGCWAKPK